MSEPMRIVGAPYNVVTGSVKSTCSDCSAGVWLAPASVRALIAHREALVWCLRCFANESRTPAGVEIVVTEDQEAELFDRTGETATDAYRRVFGIEPKKI